MTLNKTAAIENTGVEATDRLIEFCMPGLKVSARRAPPKSGDVCVPNLRRDFEALNTTVPIYESYDQFIQSLLTFIPATATEDGIYTNFMYTKEAVAAVVEAAAYQDAQDNKDTGGV